MAGYQKAQIFVAKNKVLLIMIKRKIAPLIVSNGEKVANFYVGVHFHMEETNNKAILVILNFLRLIYA